MTTKEFSDAFDTLLSSYSHKADFGDLSSYADVVLDEYEKSVFLTQAQDNIVKSYFDRLTNSTGQGFDDSIRRLVDFSSLISVGEGEAITPTTVSWNKGSKLFNGTFNTIKGPATSTYKGYVCSIKFGVGTRNVTYNISNSICYIKIEVPSGARPDTFFNNYVANTTMGSQQGGFRFQTSDSAADNYLGIFTTSEEITDPELMNGFTISSYSTNCGASFDERGQLYHLPPGILLMLNERVKSTDGKSYVVTPISYKEYDRQMSKAYAQPLKNQCWRLFEGLGSINTISEIIPKEGVLIDKYKIRYIRRPNPIILTNLNLVNSQEPLEIDGHNDVSECELHPILHMDILEEAVRLALNSKGIETREQRAAREAASKSRS